MKSRSVFLWVLLAAMILMLFQSMRRYSSPVAVDISYGAFRDHVRNGYVDSVKIEGENITGRYHVDGNQMSEGAQALPPELSGKDFETTWVGSGDELTKFLEENQIRNFEAQFEESSAFIKQLLFSGLPILLMVFLLIFIFRQVQVGGGKAMSFGKSKAKLIDNQGKVTFSDVAGIDEAKEELEEIVEFLKTPKKFTSLGGKIPRGLLLIGSPGTGKTLLARAIAGEAGVPFLSISGSDFVEMFVGVGASRVRDLFEQAKKNAPCIIFIDEIDAVGRHRGAGLGGGHDEREQTLNQLLVEMDGFEENDGVILVAATNRPDVLDPALLRPGRFDRHVTVPRPDVKGREGILNVHVKNVPLAEDVKLAVIARGTSGFTGADLKNLVNEAALEAARADRKSVKMEDFESAKDKIMLGKERKSILISDKDKKVTAYHEAGHTLVAMKIPGTDPVHKVTIIPRGMALGLTHQLPVEDKYTMNQDSAEAVISILMGGRLAEDIVFGEISNGASNDIEKASDLARKMVCEWGMSKKLGPLAFGQKNQEVFLARDMSHQPNYSEKTAQQIDEEVQSIVMRNFDRARAILVEERKTLDAISEALLTFETLDGEDLACIVKGDSIDEFRAQKERKQKKLIKMESYADSARNWDSMKELG